MSTSTGWYATQARQNPDLFRVVFDYNRRPQHWVHPSVIETLPHTSVVEALIGSAHGVRHLSAWLGRHLGLQTAGDWWDFEEPRRRLHLLGYATLERLAKYAGAALHWPHVASMISRGEIQEFKQALGDEVRAYALRRGRMVFHDAKMEPPPKSAPPLPNRCLHAGWDLLATAMSEEAEALRLRFRLKLPSNLTEFTNRDPRQEARDSAWRSLRRVAPDVFSEGELQCFA